MAKSTDTLARTFIENHPEEAARELEAHTPHELVALLKGLPVRVSRPLLERISPDVAGLVLLKLDPEQRRDLLQTLAPRQAAAALHRLSEKQLSDLLDELPEDAARTMREVLKYPPQVAGGMMDPKVTSLPVDLTAQEAITRLRRAPRDTLYYLYVTDRAGELVGVLNVRDLLLASPRDRIETMVRKPALSVAATMPRDEVLTLMRERKYLAMPVVDIDNHLIGAIKHEQALQASQLEAFEDMQKMVGAGGDERALSSVKTVVSRRLPWLFVNLLTAFLAAAVVGLFEDTIAKVTALAVLLPVVAGQGGNSGTQALAVVMRGLALREVLPGMARRVIIKEVMGGLINGLAVGLATAIAVYIWNPNIALALVIGLAMPITMVAAAFAGAIIPMALRAMGRDPAQSAGIFLTTVTDVVGFASFLGLAVVLSRWLVTS